MRRATHLMHWKHLAAMLPAMFAGPLVNAQEMADPTRPSSTWIANQNRAAGREVPVEAGFDDAQILVEGRSRVFIIVDGTVVRPGQTYNGAKLLSVSREGAVWQKGGVVERTSLSPTAAKTNAPKADDVAKNKKQKQVTGEKK